MHRLAALTLVLLSGCGPGPGLPDAAAGADAPAAGDAPGASDATEEADSRPAPDAPVIGGDGGGAGGTLAEHRERLLATLGEPCATWGALHASARAVFDTITHRLFVSRTPDGLPMLAHVTTVYAVLGGGASGTTCGGSDNNRVFVATDAYLHDLLVETWNDGTPILDGDGTSWIHTRDAAGPHDPFDASVETDTGLRCTLLFETSGSRPPTAQAHFFDGAPVAFTRGTASLPADPFLLEIDHDYNCIHDSNPTCSDFEDRYRTNHGDFECEWAPASCATTTTGCYPDVT